MAMMTSLTSFLPFRSSKGGEATSDLTKDMVLQIGRQCPSMTPEVLSHCAASKTHSKFAGCRWDIEVYDAAGKVVVHGREFGSENRYFWLP